MNSITKTSGVVSRYRYRLDTGDYHTNFANHEEGERRSEGEEDWHNRAEEIIISDVGREEFRKRLEKQNKMFEDGCKKGNFIDDISMYFSTSGVKSLMARPTKETGRRAIYDKGVGALGYVVMDPDAGVPPNCFFQKGAVYEVRVRHSNFPDAQNDSKIGFRSMSIKMSDHDYDSPMDLILSTGYLSPYFNVASIEDLHKNFSEGPERLKRYFQTMPCLLQATLEGLRAQPDSYYHQYYHSQMVYDFIGRDEKKRLARFRVIPSDGSRESGRLNWDQQKDAWFAFLLPQDGEGDRRPQSALKDEFAQRVRTAPVHYQLQAQFHEWNDDVDTHMLYNAAVPWDAAGHQWRNLATITLNTVLSPDVTEMTRFNVGNLPREVVTFPKATSKWDFNIVPQIREYVYKEMSKLRPMEPAIPEKVQTVEYLITVKTGSQPSAGNMDQKCDVSISLIGSEGRTSFHKLRRKYKADLDKNQKTTFSIFDKPIGEFICAKVYKEKKSTKSDWFLEYVILTMPYTHKCHTLPCYRWFNDITSLLTIRDGKAVLTKDEDDVYMKLMRSLEMTERQRLIQWRSRDADEDFEGFPGYIHTGDDYFKLPADMRMDELKKLEIEWKKHVNGKNSFLKQIKKIFNFRKAKLTVEYETTVADSIANKEKLRGLEHVIRNWRDDEEFGRQMINGVNPLKIVKIEEIPRNFPVTDRMVSGLMDDGETLESALARQRLYLISYPELAPYCNYDQQRDGAGLGNSSVSLGGVQMSESRDDLAHNSTDTIDPKEQPRYTCAPMVLFYLRDGKTLVPMAIQLTQVPLPDPVIYTRKDENAEYSDWMLAKMWVRVADSTVQHLGVHMLGTHLLMEPVSMAIVRNFPIVHPLFKLLFPHLRRVVALNTIYRKYVLEREEGAFAEVFALGAMGKVEYLDFIQKEMTDFKFDLFDLPENLAERGVIDHKTFPGYYYRDDALNLWEAIQDFVTEIVAIYYQEDQDVESDEEIANFLADLRSNGYPSRAGLPTRFSMVEELIRFCTTIIYRCSVHHTAVSRGMADVYSYAPNAPPCMMVPPPTRKVPQGYGELQMKEMLPPPDLIERYIGAVLLLQGGFEPPEVKLGAYSEKLFTDDKSQLAVQNFQRRLREISAEIKKRNEKIPVPYEYLLPENISNFIET